VPLPKKPKTAYCIFNTEFTQQLRAKHPDLVVTEAFKLAGERWAQLSDNEKAPYAKLADQDRELYDQRVRHQE